MRLFVLLIFLSVGGVAEAHRGSDYHNVMHESCEPLMEVETVIEQQHSSCWENIHVSSWYLASICYQVLALYPDGKGGPVTKSECDNYRDVSMRMKDFDDNAGVCTPLY